VWVSWTAAVIACSICNAYPIIVIDICDEKLIINKEACSTYIINSLIINHLIKISEITAGLGVQYALKATGLSQIMETCLSFNFIFENMCSGW
jgi:threonine dehydrogenase-like Zn-dependent dehydrogenase